MRPAETILSQAAIDRPQKAAASMRRRSAGASGEERLLIVLSDSRLRWRVNEGVCLKESVEITTKK